jgi:hypothetical protein
MYDHIDIAQCGGQPIGNPQIEAQHFNCFMTSVYTGPVRTRKPAHVVIATPRFRNHVFADETTSARYRNPHR